MYFKVLFLVLLMFFCTISNAQKKECKVLDEKLKGEYEGNCKKGLAHGEGNAKGIDKYSGSFRKGLPHGEGEYTIIKQDSTYKGFWKKGEYIGRYKTPYKVLTKRGVNRFSLYNRGTQSDFEVVFKLGGQVNFQNVSGLSIRGSDGAFLNNPGQFVGLKNVSYPLHVIVEFTGRTSLGTAVRSYIEMEIYEEGYWVMDIAIE